MFFFSSRRRHTRSKRDWSSDVCSSDLTKGVNGRRRRKIKNMKTIRKTTLREVREVGSRTSVQLSGNAKARVWVRSEERRVGKEGRARGVGEDEKERRRM